MARADILAVVEDQFYDVGKRLDGVGKRLDGVGKRLERQMTRTAEIQQELKGQTKEIAELRRTVNLAHRLLKELLARIP
jgi:septal ring factor EnvC (AmiA/AmiB activator)